MALSTPSEPVAPRPGPPLARRLSAWTRAVGTLAIGSLALGLLAAPARAQDDAPAPRGVPGGGAQDDDPAGTPEPGRDPTGLEGLSEEDRRRILVGQRLDEGLAIVGDRIITRYDLNGIIASDPELRQRMIEVRTQEEQGQVYFEALSRRSLQVLEERAGRARGFDPEIVEALLDRDFETQLGNYGGAEEFSKILQRSNLTPQAFRDMREGMMYRHAWSDSVTGSAPGPLGRVITDRFVRPGELFSTYLAFVESPVQAQAELVGRLPERLTLQRLMLDVEGLEGGTEPADYQQVIDNVARSLREQVLRGEVTFEQQTRLWDVREGRNSILEDLTLGGVQSLLERDHAGSDLVSWALTAQPGDISDGLVCTNPGVPPSVMLYHVVERKPQTEPLPFVDLGVQTALREYLEEQLDQRRLQVARQRVILESHVFPRELKRDLLTR